MDYELYAPDFAQRSGEILDRLLREAPIHYHQPRADAADRKGSTFEPRTAGGPNRPYWTVARYDDVLTVKRNPEIFSNRETITYGMTPGTFEWEVGSRRLSGNDGIYHDEVRKLCGRQMRPSVLKTFIEVLRDKAARGLDAFEACVRSGETVNWVRDFAYMYPVFAVGMLIGLPEKLMDGFADRYADGVPPTEAELRDAFADFVSYRTDHPGEDMTSDLIRAVREGSPHLAIESLHYNLIGFYLAGHLTTTHLLAWVLVELARQPELRTRLRDDHSLIPGFIEETLRLDPPVVMTFNTVEVDTELSGVALAKGDHVFSVYAAANRDPAAFADPTSFDITRSPNAHLAFSHGTHFCLGAPLARLETRVMLEDLLHRELPLDVDFAGSTGLQNVFLSLNVSLAR